MLPARLRIDQRRRKIPGKPTRDYIVPVLELPDTNFGQLVAGGFIQTTAPAIGAGEIPALGPGAAPRAQLGPGKPARVDRPALGPAPEVPTGNGFARAEPVAPPAVDPPTVGGWPVEEAPPPQELPAPEVVATLPPTGLSASALAGIARQAGKTKGELAVAIGAVTGTVPAPTGVSAVVTAMSAEERGCLADQLNLNWRAQ
jgi:hypothetical protein